ncbi:MAG: hypothetical protein H7Y01_08910 [Ferruginibacter sp.]|nr:hypothetical protein [Chitinophagaceae bacterium]
MKKASVILLLFIYGSATMGATVHLHYCMNEFVGWSLFKDKDEKCGKCGMEEQDKEGCCNDEHKQFKLKVDHQKAGVAQFVNLLNSPVLPVAVCDFNFHSYLNINERFPTCHAPPGISNLRLHVLHSTFLI